MLGPPKRAAQIRAVIIVVVSMAGAAPSLGEDTKATTQLSNKGAIDRHPPFNSEGDATMKSSKLISLCLSASVAVLAAGVAVSAQDKYTVKVENGLAFSEFRGYEDWAVIAISENLGMIAVILGNPAMIEAYKQGIPDNGKPFPDGARMAKIHWMPKKQEAYPGQPSVPGTQHDVDFMVKDSKRFADSGGWGWGAFDYDAASDTFTPSNMASSPPQGHDAKCGFVCHTAVQKRDYVFTEYGKR
jgi:Cytochrome P460